MNPRAKLTQPRLYKSAIALAALSTLSALCAAQTAAPAPAAAASAARGETLDTVIVTGFRSSLESALNKKREDNGIVDVIRAEDMGKFPDTNLAESLQRVPGVVIDRDAGEGRNITVRGLGGDFTRTRINGIEALATTGGTDSSGGANRSRTFDFNVFPADLFSTLTVRKSSSADVEEGSLGATVDLQTARPFDMKGRTANIGIKATYNDLAGSTSPKVNFLLSDTFFDRKLGVMLGGAYSKRKVFEEGFSTVRWDNGPSSTGWCSPVGVTPINPAVSTSLTSTAANCATGVPRLPNTPENVAAYTTASNAANFHPRLPRYGRLTHEQERLGLSGAVQLRPADGTLLTLDLMYSKLDATRQEDFLQAISFSRNAGQGGKPQTSVVATEYDAAGRLLYGKYNGVDIRAESRYDELSTTFTQPTLTVEQDIGESFKLTAKLGRAQSKFRNPVQTTTTLDAINVNGYEIDFRADDRLPKITYPFDVTAAGGPLQLVGVPVATSGTQATTVANTTTSEIRIRPQGSTNTNDVLALNLAWEAIPDKLSFKVGSDYKKFAMNSYEFRRVNQSDTIFPMAANIIPASLTTMVTGFGTGQSLPAGTPTSWVIPNLAAIAQAYDIYCNCIKSGPAGGPGDFTLSSVTNGNARGNNRDVVEKDTGGFLMADFSTGLGGIPLRGNVGVRYVKTDVSSTGYQALAGGTAVTVDNSYSDVLPSVNVAANVTRDVIVRLAAAKVMSRPTLGLLNPGGTISSTGTLSITNGNPLLKPFRAKTFDGSFEWYFQKNAFLGLGLFEKKISTYIQTVRQNMPFNQTGLPLSLLPSNFTGEEVFQVTAPINTEGGKLSGLEFNYQQPFTFLPAWGKNFGMLVNYTYVKSKIAYVVSPTSTATVTDDLINLSPRSMNGTLYYDDGTFSARVSASKRASFLQRVPGQNNNDVEGKNETLNVDMSISYKVTPNLDITLEGSNLTNQPNDQFISRARDSVVVNNVTGREYQIGMRYKF